MTESNVSNIEEEWRDVLGWEEYYQVSNWGRVRRKGRDIKAMHKYYGEHIKHISGRVLSNVKTNDPYKHHVLSAEGIRYSVRTHILVAKAWVSNPENKPQVNHKDGDKWNNNADNLGGVLDQKMDNMLTTWDYTLPHMEKITLNLN